jgi:hypothetical protein
MKKLISYLKPLDKDEFYGMLTLSVFIGVVITLSIVRPYGIENLKRIQEPTEKKVHVQSPVLDKFGELFMKKREALCSK